MNDLQAIFADLERQIEDVGVLAVTKATEAGIEHVRHVHSWQTKSGETQAGMYPNVAITSGGAEGVVIVEGENAIRLNDGTAPHDIYPKAGTGSMGPLQKGQSRRKRGTGGPRSVLRFEIGGDVHFAPMVHHPGTKPDPFLDQAADVMETVFESEVEKGLAQIFEGD